MNKIARLHRTIVDAGVSIIGVLAVVPGDSSTVIVTPTALQAAAQPTIDAFDWSDSAQTVFENLQARTSAVSQLGLSDAQFKLVRALVAMVVEENNTLRDQFTAQAAAIAAATSLADLKARWAALPATPDRTMAQAKNFIQNKINSGAVDS